MKCITDPSIKPGCYLMTANGQAVHGGEIAVFGGCGASRNMKIEIVVNPVDEAAMNEKLKRRPRK